MVWHRHLVSPEGRKFKRLFLRLVALGSTGALLMSSMECTQSNTGNRTPGIAMSTVQYEPDSGVFTYQFALAVLRASRDSVNKLALRDVDPSALLVTPGGWFGQIGEYQGEHRAVVFDAIGTDTTHSYKLEDLRRPPGTAAVPGRPVSGFQLRSRLPPMPAEIRWLRDTVEVGDEEGDPGPFEHSPTIWETPAQGLLLAPAVGTAGGQGRPNILRVPHVAWVSLLVVPSARISLDVLDTAGRVRRVLIRESRLHGSRTSAWDGRDDRGRRLPVGRYRVRLSASGEAVGELGVTLDR